MIYNISFFKILCTILKQLTCRPVNDFVKTVYLHFLEITFERSAGYYSVFSFSKE